MPSLQQFRRFRQTDFYPSVYVQRLRRYGHCTMSCDRYTPSREDLIFHLNASKKFRRAEIRLGMTQHHQGVPSRGIKFLL
jgi:hypothetical protein